MVSGRYLGNINSILSIHNKYMQTFEYASMWVCKYASMQVFKCASIKVCKYENIQVFKYVSTQLCKYASMHAGV